MATGSVVAGELYYELDGQLAEIKRQLRQQSGYPFDPLVLKLHLQAAIEGRFNKSAYVSGILHVLANLSLSDRIARGKYDWVNDYVTEEHFPTSISADYDAEYRLFHFDRDISSEVAIQEMEKEGFRPGTLAELLALGEAQPELQKQFPVIALGSLWRGSSGSRHVPALDWHGGRRELYLRWFGRDWDAPCRFLAVRK